jgi:SAM-dependent methyltransferase
MASPNDPAPNASNPAPPSAAPAPSDNAWWHRFFDEDALWLYGPTLDDERTEREVTGAWRLLRLAEGMRVADLGCGDGRHAVPLARRGVRVTGVDWSRPALERMARRAARVEVAAGMVRGDLRLLPLRDGCADAAMALFSTLGYESDERTLQMMVEARRILRAGGRLLVEVTGRDFAVRSFHTRREWAEVQGRPVLVERWIDLAAGEERAVFRYDRGEGPKERHFRRRLYTPGELGALLRAAGFARVVFHGDYEGAPLTLDSPLLLAVAR